MYACLHIGTKTVSFECLDGDCGTVKALRLFSEMECRKKLEKSSLETILKSAIEAFSDLFHAYTRTDWIDSFQGAAYHIREWDAGRGGGAGIRPRHAAGFCGGAWRIAWRWISLSLSSVCTYFAHSLILSSPIPFHCPGCDQFSFFEGDFQKAIRLGKEWSSSWQLLL